MSEYQIFGYTVNPCPDCYPITKWEAMTDEELEAVGLDSRNLPSPPGKTWKACYPWLVIKCESCGRVLAEFDAVKRRSIEE